MLGRSSVKRGEERSSDVVHIRSGAEYGKRGWKQEEGARRERRCICDGGTGASSVQNCKDVYRFDDVGAETGDDYLELPQDAVSVTESEAENTGVEDGLEGDGDGEPGELRFGLSRNV